MEVVCDECGYEGIGELFLRCRRCKNAARHRCCLDAIIFDSVVRWLCSDCMPKHNEANKSLGGVTNQRKLRNTQIGSSIIKKPNVEKEKVTIARGLHRNRAHRKGNNHVDESTKHSSRGDTFNRERNRTHKERRDAITTQSCSGDALDSSATLGGDIPNDNDCGKCEPLKAVEVLEKSVIASKYAPKLSNLMQGSHLKIGNVNALKPIKKRLGSWSGLPVQSSSYNELEDMVVQENKSQRTRHLADEGTVVPILKNRGSNPSMENAHLVSNEDNSGEADRRTANILSSIINKKMRRRARVDREIVKTWKVNGISDPDSAQGDRDASIGTSYHGVKKMILSRVLQEEGINSELLPCKFVGPCESAKMNPRKRKQSESYDPDGIKYQKAGIINENKNVNVKRSKSSSATPVASMRDCLNMPRKENGRSDKVNGHSKIGKDEISSTTKELRDDNKPKKRRRLILPYDEEEDGEALHVVNLNSRSCDNDGNVKKQRIYMEDAAKNSIIYVEEDDEEALRSVYLNHQNQVKKQRRIEENKDENGSLSNLNAGCAEKDVSQLALQTGVTEDHYGIFRMPLVPDSIGTQPLDKPYWTAIMKIDENYMPLSAHLSTKAGKKVQELSRSLPPIIKVTKLSTLESCSKYLEAPMPSAGSIDLYFFCGDMRPNKELDQLVKHVADSGIILEAIVGLDKLCLFPSFVLPGEYQKFQGKPYLWGVFKPRKDEIERLAPAEQDCTAHITEEEHVQEPHVLDQQNKANSEKQPLLGNETLVSANPEVGNEALSGSVLPLIDMRALVSANISPADHGQPCSNPETPPLKLCGFVVARTPRSAQLIQEMQKEGALLFAVQQVVPEPGSSMV